MKLFQLILVLILFQTSCMGYTSPTLNQRMYNHAYRKALYNRALFNRGVMTGIPVPIYQYTPAIIPEVQQPAYVKRKHIKKKYRKYYPIENENSFTVIEY